MTISASDLTALGLFFKELTLGMVLGLFAAAALFLVLMFKFFKPRNGNGNGNGNGSSIPDRRNDANGMTVLEYLQHEIKPEITNLRKDHIDLRATVASLPTREELDKRLTTVHERINKITQENPQ